MRSDQPLVVGTLITIWEGSAKNNCISPLHVNGLSLEQEWGPPRVTRRYRQSTTQFAEKTHALIVYGSEGFDRDWYKISWTALIAWYFICLSIAAHSDAAPGELAVIWRRDAASVSGHVTSHVKHLTIFKITNVIPSVFFSSFKNRPFGSLGARTPDRMHARKIMSFNILCLLVRPALLLHDNPWMPKASTSAPQWQLWGAHKFTPSLKPMATRTASSSSLKPQDETGMAFNQSPQCGACAGWARPQKALQGM